jgi:hypothetical protein
MTGGVKKMPIRSLASALSAFNARSPRRARPVVSLAFECLEGRSVPAVFVVTSTGDAGAGTLRQAILDANGSPNGVARDEIHFNVAGVGIQVIRPTTNLPAITDPVVIDGYSQLGAVSNSSASASNAVIKIQLDGGNDHDPVPIGLTITAGGSTVQGLCIANFTTLQFTPPLPDAGVGISISGAGGNSIIGNFIGLNADGGLPADC